LSAALVFFKESRHGNVSIQRRNHTHYSVPHNLLWRLINSGIYKQQRLLYTRPFRYPAEYHIDFPQIDYIEDHSRSGMPPQLPVQRLPSSIISESLSVQHHSSLWYVLILQVRDYYFVPYFDDLRARLA
jgi:hypothetical protein